MAPELSLSQLLPEPQLKSLEVDPTQSLNDLSWRLINRVYDLGRDHRALAEAVASAVPIGQAFDSLRKNYLERREFSSLTLEGVSGDTELGRRLQAFGFNLGA